MTNKMYAALIAVNICRVYIYLYIYIYINVNVIDDFNYENKLICVAFF